MTISASLSIWEASATAAEPPARNSRQTAATAEGDRSAANSATDSSDAAAVAPQNPASLYARTNPGFQRRQRPGEWELLFKDGTQAAEYARQLDYFGIELGAIAKDGKVQYASLVSKAKPARRNGAQEEDQRLYNVWKQGTLMMLDKKLLSKAGISTTDKTIAHFYPFVLEQELAELEIAFAGRKPEEIRRTRFRVRDKADKAHEYEFFVEEQDQVKPGEFDSRHKPMAGE